MSNRYLLILLSALLFTVSACKLGPVNWPEVVRCGPGVDDLIGIVSEVLLGEGNVQTELENLALTNGTDTVVCLVEQLRSDWSAPGAAASPVRAHGVERAVSFLDDIGTELEFE